MNADKHVPYIPHRMYVVVIFLPAIPYGAVIHGNTLFNKPVERSTHFTKMFIVLHHLKSEKKNKLQIIFYKCQTNIYFLKISRGA